MAQVVVSYFYVKKWSNKINQSINQLLNCVISRDAQDMEWKYSFLECKYTAILHNIHKAYNHSHLNCHLQVIRADSRSGAAWWCQRGPGRTGPLAPPGTACCPPYWAAERWSSGAPGPRSVCSSSPSHLGEGGDGAEERFIGWSGARPTDGV